MLDAGCGTGENTLFFASRGQKVTGIDFLAEGVACCGEEGSVNLTLIGNRSYNFNGDVACFPKNG